MVNRGDNDLKIKNKVKSNKGSALVLAILATALLSIVVVIITSQINNQLRFNKRSYDDMKSKYAAEAGIEKSIHEIVNDIEKIINEADKLNSNNKITIYNSNAHSDNDSCPKVRLENGMPIIGNISVGDGFYKLVYHEILNMKSNVVYNSAFGPNLVSVLGEEHYLLGKENIIRKYYENNIRNLIENIATGHEIYNSQKLESNINYFIKMINIIMTDVKNKNHYLKDIVLSDLKKMEDYMLDIKCRLRMSNSSSTPETNNGKIDIPYYNVSIVNNNLSFADMNGKPNKSVNVEIEYDENNNIIDIDLSNLNAESLEAVSDDYRIRADIDFIFVKNGSTYEIQQRVNTYERIN